MDGAASFTVYAEEFLRPSGLLSQGTFSVSM